MVAKHVEGRQNAFKGLGNGDRRVDASQGDGVRVDGIRLPVDQSLRLLDVVETVEGGRLWSFLVAHVGKRLLCGFGWDYGGYDAAGGLSQAIGVIDHCVSRGFLGAGERVGHPVPMMNPAPPL